jgi:transcriptional regulator with XRE-family HTH domain
MMDEISFGQVVKERRSALGLTQTELARRVGCAAITIRKIEADGLRPSVQMAELIALALNIPEAEQLAFVRLARADIPHSPIPIPAPTPGEIGLTDLSGRAVKGFQLGERMGSGGFGVVYRALQPSVGREVAIKIILPRYANHPNFIRRFEAEAHLIAQLEHPHIVPLYDYWREPDAAYLIMRLLRGGSLEDQLKNGPIPLPLISQYTRQIGLALDVAHRHGVIHRDIKPANVLLDEEANAYLADFGIAKNLEGVNGHSLTEDGVLIGSPAYISPDGQYLLTASEDRTARLWDVATGQTIQTFVGHTDHLVVADFSPDGKYVVTSSADNTARLWDVATGQTIQTFVGHNGRVIGVVFSPDGTYVATTGVDETARLWDVATGEQVQVFEGHQGPVSDVRFSPDGTLIATAGDDRMVRLWDAATGEQVQLFEGHQSWVLTLAFSPDGKYLLSGSNDRTARLWDVATGESIQDFAHPVPVDIVAYSPDG